MSPDKPRLSRKVLSIKSTVVEPDALPVQADAFASSTTTAPSVEVAAAPPEAPPPTARPTAAGRKRRVSAPVEAQIELPVIAAPAEPPAKTRPARAPRAKRVPDQVVNALLLDDIVAAAQTTAAAVFEAVLSGVGAPVVTPPTAAAKRPPTPRKRKAKTPTPEVTAPAAALTAPETTVVVGDSVALAPPVPTPSAPDSGVQETLVAPMDQALDAPAVLSEPVAAETTVAPAAPEGSPAGASIQVIHRMHPIALGRKRDVLQQLLTQITDRPSLVYTRTKHGADKIARCLERAGFKAAAIHGDKSHGARARALAGFKSGELNALVITDIAARLLDVEGLPMVLNYDLPHIADDYVQRVCRTGTVDTPGLAVTIITQEEAPQFRAVRDLINAPIELVPLPGFEAAEAFDPERDPPVRADAEVADAAPAAPVAEAKREEPARVRRDRRGRPIREARPRPALAVAAEAPNDAGGEQELPGDAQPKHDPAAHSARPPREHGARTERQPRTDRPRDGARSDRQPRTDRPLARTDRPVRNERKARVDKPFRGDRQPRAPRGDEQPMDDRQPFYDAPPPLNFDDDDGPSLGNSLAAPPPSQINANIAGRRRGRRDPFATVVIDEDRANIFDERQPDSYRDQWSVLGPDTNRPAWTYAEHEPQLVSDSVVKAPVARPSQPGRRKGPGGHSQQPAGQARGPQRHGRPRRAEGR